MVIRKSPGGSLFPYPYKGGELMGLHYGSFFADEEALLARMKGEEEFIAGANHALPLWIDFYQTKLSDRVLVEFLGSMSRLRPHMTRLAIVGCSARDRRRLLRLERESAIELPVPLQFFDDPEQAKTWLVSEAR
jgi:hypothetical protein